MNRKPGSSRERQAAALSRHRSGDARGAIGDYRRLLDGRAGQPYVLHMLGVAYLTAGDSGRALNCKGRAVEANPAARLVCSNLSSVHLNREGFEPARVCARRSLALRWKDPVPGTNPGLAETALGNAAQAAWMPILPAREKVVEALQERDGITASETTPPALIARLAQVRYSGRRQARPMKRPSRKESRLPRSPFAGWRV